MQNITNTATQGEFTTVDWIGIGILIVTSIGILALFIASYLDRRAITTHNIKIACHSIIREIDEMERAYTDGRFERVQYDDVSYTDAFFSTDSYDSLVNSGILLEFSKTPQNRLANFYITVNLRNEAIRELKRYGDRFFIDGVTQPRLDRWNNDERSRYEIPITIYEKYILDNFVTIRKTMSDELLVTGPWRIFRPFSLNFRR